MNQSQRPGVYSSYTVTSLYHQGASLQGAAILAFDASLATPQAVTPHAVSSLGELLTALPEKGAMYQMAALLLKGGVSTVHLVSPLENTLEGYTAALPIVSEIRDVGVVIPDFTQVEFLTALKESVLADSLLQKERIFVCGIEDTDAAAATAATLNCERAVVVCPAACDGTQTASAAFSACAIGAMLISTPDPSHNHNGAILSGLSQIPSPLSEEKIQSLLKAGVTVLEQVGGNCECIRALSTRTTTDGVADNTFRSVNTVLIIDHIISSIRTGLRTRLKGAKNNVYTRESIASQVAIALSVKRDAGMITDFEAPLVYSDPTDPAVCVVDIAFTVATVLSQIHLVAHITV